MVGIKRSFCKSIIFYEADSCHSVQYREPLARCILKICETPSNASDGNHGQMTHEKADPNPKKR